MILLIFPPLIVPLLYIPFIVCPLCHCIVSPLYNLLTVHSPHYTFSAPTVILYNPLCHCSVSLLYYIVSLPYGLPYSAPTAVTVQSPLYSICNLRPITFNTLHNVVWSNICDREKKSRSRGCLDFHSREFMSHHSYRQNPASCHAPIAYRS